MDVHTQHVAWASKCPSLLLAIAYICAHTVSNTMQQYMQQYNTCNNTCNNTVQWCATFAPVAQGRDRGWVSAQFQHHAMLCCQELERGWQARQLSKQSSEMLASQTYISALQFMILLQRAAVRRMLTLEMGNGLTGFPPSHPSIRQLVTKNGLVIFANLVRNVGVLTRTHLSPPYFVPDAP